VRSVTDDAAAWAATARDIHDITQVKYRYLRALDTKDWELFASVFVPEATGDYNGLIFDDAAALVDYMRSNMTEGMLTLHQAHHPEIEVDGDAATGRWYLQDKVIIEAFKFVLEGAALYQDRYTRTPDGWKISHTGYRRTFEQTYSLDDLPSMKVGGPGTATYASTD
jgi:hypothetical protein